MNDIDELQRRITAAMDRVAGGLDQLGSASTENSAEIAQALEDEKIANAQLTERIRVLKERQDTEVNEAKAASDAATERLAQLDLELQRVRKVNEELRNSISALREANENGVGEPHLINKAMMAELEALRATRAADIAETDAIIDALTPLVTNAGGAN